MSHAPEPDDELALWVASTVQRALAFAVSLVRNRADAEDIVQDCYGRLLAKAGEYDLPRDGARLLHKAVANACINLTQRRPPVSPLNPTPSGHPALIDPSQFSPEHRAIEHELHAALADALSELPVNQRVAIQMSSIGHSIADIAETLEINSGHARVLLHRARLALAAKLRPFLQEQVD